MFIVKYIFGAICLVVGLLYFAWDHQKSAIVMLLLALLNFVIGGISTVNDSLEKKPNEKVVITSVQPQIDTTVTIINGVADTTYTYHFYDYEKIK